MAVGAEWPRVAGEDDAVAGCHGEVVPFPEAIWRLGRVRSRRLCSRLNRKMLRIRREKSRKGALRGHLRYSDVIPIVRSHASTDRGQSVTGNEVRRKPNACPPCAYRCISAGTPRFLQGSVVDQRLIHTVRFVVLCLHQECGRFRRSPERSDSGCCRPSCRREMPRIDEHRKIRAGALFVGVVHRRVEAWPVLGADFRREISAGREPEHADLVGIDMPIAWREGAPARRFFACPPRTASMSPDRRGGNRSASHKARSGRDTSQNAGDPPGCQPVADFGAFEVDRQHLEAAGREAPRTAAPVFFPLGERTRHRRPRDVQGPRPGDARRRDG